MLSKSVFKALNDQINLELHSFYSYRAMAIYCDSTELPGCADWLKKQADEEMEHAEKIIEYVLDRGEAPDLSAIAACESKFKNCLEVFKAGLAQEQQVSGSINKIYELAINEKDYATQVFLNWFIEEQVEEEASLQALVGRLERIGDNVGALHTFDNKIASNRE